MRYRSLIFLAVLGSSGCGADEMEDIGVSRFALDVANGTEFKSKLTADPNGSYRLTSDIDMGGAALQVSAFFGQLDGAGHTIKNVTQLLSTSSGDAGLFRLLQGTVKNLKLINVNFRALSAGGLASQCAGATVQNVAVQGKVEAGSNAGGICGGMSGGSLTGSSASGSVKSGSGDAGGLVGRSSIGRSGLGPTVSSCSVASMTVTGVQSAGGLMGYCQDPTILRASVDATVSGQSTAGGICGEVNGGKISSSYAKGASVTASGGPAGGLVGRAGMGLLTGALTNGVEIVSAYAQYTNVTAGTQTGTHPAGGIVGAGTGMRVNDVYAVGDVTGRGSVGGLIGQPSCEGDPWALFRAIYRGNVIDANLAPPGGWAGTLGQATDLGCDARTTLLYFNRDLDTSSTFLSVDQHRVTTNELITPTAPTSANGGVFCPPSGTLIPCGDDPFTSPPWDFGTSSQNNVLMNMPGPNTQLR